MTRGEGGGDNGGVKGKGLDKEHVWMTHGHGQECGSWLTVGAGGGIGRGGQRRESWDNCNRITVLIVYRYILYSLLLNHNKMIQ